MAEITRLSRLVGGVQRGVDLATNTLVVLEIKVGGAGGSGTTLTKTILDSLIAHLDGGASKHDASEIDVEGTGNYYSAGDLETALDDIDAQLALTEATAQSAQADATAAQADADDLISLSGRPAGSTDLGTFTGSIIPDASTVKAALQSLETSIEALPDPLVYKGTWNATTNTPALANADTGKTGWLYQVSVAGTVDFGAGNIAFDVGDKVVNNGTVWEKWDMTDAVTSVNGQSGAVTLTTDNVNEGATNKYFSVAAARAAAVVNSTAGSETDQAPSVSSIKSYVNTQIAAVNTSALSRSVPAGEAMAATTLFAVRWGRPADSETSGRLYKASNDASSTDNFHVVGIVLTVGAATAGTSVTVTKLGKLIATGHGFTVGQPIWLSTAGALTNTAPSAANSAAVMVGIAEDSNTIDVTIQNFGVN